MSLEQLMGSSSFGSAFATQFSLDGYNCLGVALLFIWMLSPLAGQSSFRLLSVVEVQRQSPTNVSYLDYNWNSIAGAQMPGIFETEDILSTITLLKSIYAASLIAPATFKSSPVDLWGNAKVPDLLHNGQATGESGWLNVNVTDPDLTYSSLHGNPIMNIPLQGQTTFTIETSYITSTCQEILTTSHAQDFQPIDYSSDTYYEEMIGDHGRFWSVFPNITDEFRNVAPVTPIFNFALASNVFLNLSSPSDIDNRQAQGTLVVQSLNLDPDVGITHPLGIPTYTTAFCSLSTTYVESSILCESLKCTVTAIRQSINQHSATNITTLMDPQVFIYFAASLDEMLPTPNGFVTATGLQSRVTQMYLQDPHFSDANSSTYFGAANLTNVANSQFSIRLQQAINNFWQSYMHSMLVMLTTGPNPPAPSDFGYVSTKATNITSESYSFCVWPWLAVYFLATSVMLATAIAGVWLAWRVQGPEVLGYCSSLIKDSRYVAAPGSSATRATERTKQLKTLKLRLADVQGDRDVGRVAIVKAEDVGVGTIVPLRKDRRYR